MPSVVNYEINTSEYKVWNRDNIPPLRPTYIMPTHVNTTASLKEIDSVIATFLNMDGVSFEFNEQYHKWTIEYISGAHICKLEVNVFQDINQEVMTIEANRLRGDAYLFQDLFRRLRAILNKEPVPTMNNFMPMPIPDNLAVKLSDEDARAAIEPMIELAKDKNEYNQRIGVQVLCEICLEGELIHQIIDMGCVELLQGFTNSTNEEIRKLSNIALNKLSEGKYI